MIAMQRAFYELSTRSPVPMSAALVDGNRAPSLTGPACIQTPVQTIIKGDQKSLSIAAASIVAKVTRDRLMAEAAQRFPGYGFETHKGYATAVHRASIKTLGPCPIHRLTWAPFQTRLLSETKRGPV